MTPALNFCRTNKLLLLTTSCCAAHMAGATCFRNSCSRSHKGVFTLQPNIACFSEQAHIDSWCRLLSIPIANTLFLYTQGYELLWSGDSVLELMRGVSIGYTFSGTQEYVSVYNQYFPASYNSHISAISGEEIRYKPCGSYLGLRIQPRLLATSCRLSH